MAKLADLSAAPAATWKCRGSVNGRFAGPGATLRHGSLPAGSDGAPLWPGGQRGEQSHAPPRTAETAGLRGRTGWRAGTAESPPHPPLRVVRPETPRFRICRRQKKASVWGATTPSQVSSKGQSPKAGPPTAFQSLSPLLWPLSPAGLSLHAAPHGAACHQLAGLLVAAAAVRPLPRGICPKPQDAHQNPAKSASESPGCPFCSLGAVTRPTETLVFCKDCLRKLNGSVFRALKCKP